MRKIVLLFLVLAVLLPAFASAQETEKKDGVSIPSIEINVKDAGSNKEMASSIKQIGRAHV